MQAAGKSGSIVTLLCDSGERYHDTYYDPGWVCAQIGDMSVDLGDLYKPIAG